MSKLSGMKTYLSAAAMAIAVFLRAMGWLDQEQYEMLLGLLAALGLGALRASNSKIEEKL